MEAILKFFENDKPAPGKNPIVSKTLGKVAIIARAYGDRVARSNGSLAMPQSQEFWRVRILKELERGSRKGCFLVEPIVKVEYEDILHLVPGMYTHIVEHGRMLVTPNPEYQGRACILPLDHKQLFSQRNGISSMIVDVSTKPVAAIVESITRDPANPYK